MKIFCYLLLTLMSLNAGFIEEFSKNSKVVVVYGKEATDEEKDVANYIFKVLELDQTGDLYDHIIDDAYALKHKYFYAKFHLIIIGTAKTNRLFSPLADIQTWDPSRKSNLPALSSKNHIQDGYFFAKYGHFKAAPGFGYVRHMLNPFTLEAFNLSNGTAKLGPMTATYITGADIKGLKNAYTSLLDSNLLEGVIVPESLPTEQTSRFQLGNAALNYIDDINTDLVLTEEEHELKFFGWQQGSLADYSGSYKLSGVQAKQICHLKYATQNPSLTTSDNHQNSILAIRYKNPDESLKALEGIAKSLKLPIKIEASPEAKAYRCAQVNARWLLIRKGNWLMIENLPMGWKEVLVKNAAKLFR
ncbi:MAG: hypothetical protein MK132_22520 [Lentisphaerales bacterium]|nr:hypothetical protein [Lentisphaerales bacterium]